MERDFLALGLSVKQGRKEDERGDGNQDFARPAPQWPFARGAAAPSPPVVPLQKPTPERPRQLVFDRSHPCFNRSDSFPGNNRPPPVMNSHVSVPSAPAAGEVAPLPRRNSFPVGRWTVGAIPVSHSPTRVQSPVTPAGKPLDPFTSVATAPVAANPVVGTYGPRNPVKVADCSQLTVFYAGRVCVFNNVPANKAHELLILASKSMNTKPPPVSPAPSPSPVTVPVSLPDPPNVKPAAAPILAPPALARQMSVTSPLGLSSRSGSSSNNTELAATSKPACTQPPTPTPTAQHDQSQASHLPPPVAATTAAIIPRAVPQARKASLARFFESRKGRVAATAPYECRRLAGVNKRDPSPSCPDISLPIDTQQSQMRQLAGGSSVSTRLQI